MAPKYVRSHAVASRAPAAYDAAADDTRYDRIQTELSQLKVQLSQLKQTDVATSVKQIALRRDRPFTAQANILDYSPDEILTQVELDLPAASEHRKKLENDRLIIKQLLANIERNRVKWLKEEQAADAGGTDFR